jgi:hypothetical protein
LVWYFFEKHRKTDFLDRIAENVAHEVENFILEFRGCIGEGGMIQEGNTHGLCNGWDVDFLIVICDFIHQIDHAEVGQEGAGVTKGDFVHAKRPVFCSLKLYVVVELLPTNGISILIEVQMSIGISQRGEWLIIGLKERLNDVTNNLRKRIFISYQCYRASNRDIIIVVDIIVVILGGSVERICAIETIAHGAVARTLSRIDSGVFKESSHDRLLLRNGGE